MAFIPLPNGVRVAMEYTLQGELIVNVYHFTTASPITTVNLTALAAVLADMFITDMAGLYSTDLSLQQVVATDVSEADGIQIVYNTGLPVAGGSANDSAPNNVAVVMSLRTGLTGRSRRGRNYYGGIDETLIAGNTPSAGFQSNMFTANDNMQLAADTLGFTWVVASYRHLGAPRVTALATPITTLIMDARSDSMRKRLPGT